MYLSNATSRPAGGGGVGEVDSGEEEGEMDKACE
jgi:hypothetical protein